MPTKKRPAVIYHAWRDGEDTIINELRKEDAEYETALRNLDNEYEYYTSRRKAVSVLREYLKDRIRGLRLALSRIK